MVLVFFVGFEGSKVNWVVAKNNSLPNFYIVIMSIAKNPVINLPKTGFFRANLDASAS